MLRILLNIVLLLTVIKKNTSGLSLRTLISGCFLNTKVRKNINKNHFHYFFIFYFSVYLVYNIGVSVFLFKFAC